ncbi:MAG: hypothetical protein ACOVOV_01215 [Dolichospermum sp.]|jgi:hypothetical protein|uniref:Uncharacterized protein n=1 Tax=Microcystis aeruginosa KW TaxID=1960155 RepID=A0A1V4BLG1_MICAE|nr:hypothetical protein [Microcystis aeruginosa]OPF14521.1 hypothetical protein B1L04_28280 [Microcystis aeruginosa KW]ROI10198.1 hypothetical protein ED562_05320 [Microcystis aeruginosa FACHB-524]
MWDIIFQAAAGILVGAAVGYGVASIIDALSRKFAQVWQEFVATAKVIWSYVSEATQHFLALVSQYLENNWPEITTWLLQEFGYASSWVVGLLAEGNEAFLVFANPNNLQGQSGIISLGVVKDKNIQLPTMQNPIVTTIALS